MMACSISVNVPTTETGLTDTFEFNEKLDSHSDYNEVSIDMGAGTLDIAAGASNLVEGTIKYNVDAWEPRINRYSNEINIRQTTDANMGIPTGNIINDWDVKLGDMPISLELNAGAYEGNLDLSELSIVRLAISDGASKATVRFDSPNPVKMEELTYETGASNVELIGLGNANVSKVYFDSGVGSYTLDFSGEIKDDIEVFADSGMSDITITIPENAQAKVILDGGLSNVDVNGTWTISGNVYECGDSGPMITIRLDMAVGNLNLRRE